MVRRDIRLHRGGLSASQTPPYDIQYRINIRNFPSSIQALKNVLTLNTTHNVLFRIYYIEDGPASVLPLTQTLSNIYGRRSASPDVPGTDVDEIQKTRYDNAGVEEQLPPPPSPPQLKETAQLDGVPRPNSVDRILQSDGIQHISHEALNKRQCLAHAHTSSKYSPPTVSSPKILASTAKSMDAASIWLVTVGEQTFHVTECCNSRQTLRTYFRILIEIIEARLPGNNLAHPSSEGGKSPGNSPQNRMIPLPSTTCSAPVSEPLQSNHQHRDETPASSDARHDNNALVSIQVSGAQRVAVSVRPGNPRKDSSGIVSGLDAVSPSSGCSFREVAVRFALPCSQPH
ncbi:hypothetical protein EAG_02672 [Camponotus floridanus]|uniref:Uncharacterized protein n=1 Tax=Camponotus floridanus TaxID=104421 RepID=E1ZYM6_CAMFO|nr:hypothetical protein EAG_02672 [Camponotus floridanus]